MYYFDVEKCKTCPMREGCYKPGAKSKTYSIRIIAEHFKEQIEFELSDAFKERIKRRPIIEHKNAEMKRFHGMDTAKYRGLFRMRIQAFLTAFAVNAKRMVKLIEQKQPTPRVRIGCFFSLRRLFVQFFWAFTSIKLRLLQ